MPNLTALFGVVVGVIALFVSPGVGVKWIAVYLLLTGLLRLFAAPVEGEDAPRPAKKAPPLEEPEDSFRTAAAKAARIRPAHIPSKKEQ